MKIEQFMDKLNELINKAEIIEGVSISASTKNEDDTVDMIECNIDKFVPKSIVVGTELIADGLEFDPDMLDKTSNPGVSVVPLPYIEPIKPGTKEKSKWDTTPVETGNIGYKEEQIPTDIAKVVKKLNEETPIEYSSVKLDTRVLFDQFGRPIFVEPNLTGPSCADYTSTTDKSYPNTVITTSDTLGVYSPENTSTPPVNFTDTLKITGADTVTTATVANNGKGILDTLNWNCVHSPSGLDGLTAATEATRPEMVTAAMNTNPTMGAATMVSKPEMGAATAATRAEMGAATMASSDEIFVTSRK